MTIRIYKLVELRQLLQKRYTTHEAVLENDVFQQEDAFVETFKTYILANLDDDSLDSEILGKHFGMSRMQLHRKIKALTNLATGEYVRVLCMEVALKLLKEKNLTISEIAYKTGFSSPSHFSRTFKKYYQKLPSDF